MIGLDTNVIVRFLVEDDARRAQRARKLIQGAIEEHQAVFLSDIVLCETVWVLESCYKLRRLRIAEILRSLLSARHVQVAVADRVTRATTAYAERRGDFADYLLREHAQEAGCEVVYTFDRALKSDDGFRLA